MKGLTAKVFHTYNASITLQQQLDDNTPENASIMELLAYYNKATKLIISSPSKVSLEESWGELGKDGGQGKP